MAGRISKVSLIFQEVIEFGKVDYTKPDILKQTRFRERRSPIIATLGDPNISHVDIQKMMEIGVNAVRLKTSHCTRGEKIRMIGKVDKASAFLCQKYGVLDWPCATCVELKTCIVKTGIIAGTDDFLILAEDSELVLTYNLDEIAKCTKNKIFVDNPYLATDIDVGMLISIAQDEIILQCVKILRNNCIKCVVKKGGKLASMSTVCVRGGRKSFPHLTKKDLSMVRFAMQYQVDMILINYVRNPITIKKIKQFMGRKYKRPLLMSGICTEEGLKNIDDIIKESDGIVLSREYLTYELEENARFRLMRIQKWIGAKCLQAGKPFFVSGEVFQIALSRGEFIAQESAEVANSILDGATGFILSDCTDTERVLQVVEQINTLCCNIEPFTNDNTDFWRNIEGIPLPVSGAEAAAVSCAALANLTKSRAIVIPTVTGITAKILMWLRPVCLVLTVSTQTGATRRLQTYRSCIPLMYRGGSHRGWHSAIDARVRFAIEYAVKMGWLQYGDPYVTLQRGTENSAYCDMVRVWRVTTSKKLLVECDEDGNPVKETHRHI